MPCPQYLRCTPHTHKVMSSNPRPGMDEFDRSSFTTASPHPGVMGVGSDGNCGVLDLRCAKQGVEKDSCLNGHGKDVNCKVG